MVVIEQKYWIAAGYHFCVLHVHVCPVYISREASVTKVTCTPIRIVPIWLFHIT